jgi:hypothetical protein
LAAACWEQAAGDLYMGGREDHLDGATRPPKGVSDFPMHGCRECVHKESGQSFVSPPVHGLHASVDCVCVQLDGDLFLMPSFGGGTTSEGGDTDAQGGPISKHSSRGTGSHHQQQEVYGGAGLMQQDW